MPNIGPLEIAILLAIALIVFGPKRLPELGNSLGRGIREFRGSVAGNDSESQPELAASASSASSAVKAEVVATPADQKVSADEPGAGT